MVSATVHVPARPQSIGEEIANSISHAAGLLAAMFAIPILIGKAFEGGDFARVMGAGVFATTVVLLYFTSTLYHALPANKAKRVFRLLDHGAIYLLIAGTYTPFMLGVLRGPWGWTLLAAVWTLAACGIMLKALGGMRYPKLSIALYLLMGWMVVVAAKPLLLGMLPRGLVWLAAGGLAYTAGVLFYVTDARVRYGHFVWHLFVLAGTTCHFIAVMRYAA
jgi:hemolysin III